MKADEQRTNQDDFFRSKIILVSVLILTPGNLADCAMVKEAASLLPDLW